MFTNTFGRRATRTLWVWLALAAACGDPGMDGGKKLPPDATVPDARVPDVPAATACKGQPASCDAFDLSLSTDCEAQVGCVAERSCRAAFGFSCFSVGNESECTRIGCSWTSSCESNGTGTLCFTANDQASCAAKPGCLWQSFCDPLGHPTDPHCEPFTTEATCKNAEACEWGYRTCSGTSAACSTLGETSCKTQRGCAWMP
jgi:hypothetical protein